MKIQARSFSSTLGELHEWWPILLGLLTMLVPTLIELYNGIWQSEEQAHGPLIFLVVLYLIWEKRTVLNNDISQTLPKFGWLCLTFGLFLYVVGRSQEILIFEVGAFIPVLVGTLLITKGKNALRKLWFPIFFILFMLPLPGFLVDGLTGPLKQNISQIAETVLYHVGYPIARSGVTITIGQYQLLVADACSGLHSMFSLSALGLLYLYLAQHKSWWRNAIIITSILPMAFFANIVRVVVLILVTFHFGDEAGQGFIHGIAGILLFVVALLGLIGLDAFIGAFTKQQKVLT
jgi:exosortase B